MLRLEAAFLAFGSHMIEGSRICISIYLVFYFGLLEEVQEERDGA